ncbi:MAG: ArsI/CadI family heavy metal resistance metalloenzyme [Gammaproteobacteria bacterium]|jgi:catechol 2,3-dioxygenase-like lactoylglutathione lyase family enzyme
MKRFHVHIAVDDLAANIRYYSAMFGVSPTVEKSDYAKWMIDDPRINFAISTRGHKAGLDHLGLQVESDEELAALRGQVERAQFAAIDQPDTVCCYSRSDKHWMTDPQGIAWETFRTLESMPMFSDAVQEKVDKQSSACCAPTATTVSIRSIKGARN